jgi:hypothetical protein
MLYVAPATLPTAFSSDEEERMYQFPPLVGPGFQMDNMAVYRKLKAFLVDSPGWAWIEPHDMAENERLLTSHGLPTMMETAN